MSCQKIVTYAGAPVKFRDGGFTLCPQPGQATVFPDEASAWLKVKEVGLPWSNCAVEDLE